MGYNIFISHSWTYSDAYDSLKKLLQQSPYFSFTDFSVPKNNPIHTRGSDAQLYQAILNKMRLCHVILIMAGVYSSYSKWIDKEIRIATKEFSSPKRIIGVRPWAQTNISSRVREAADEIVGWNTTSIITAIRRR